MIISMESITKGYDLRQIVNLNHLAVFHAVAETGGVVRGAERLHITQPAVSKQIKELEAALGVPLFDRLGRGVHLTPAGETLAAYARRLFAIEAEAEQAIAEFKGLKRGRLAVGASTTVGIYLLPEVLGTFRREYPGIELRLEVGNTEAIQRQVRENMLDVGLIEGAATHPAELEATLFQEDELVAIVAPEHPLLASDQPVAAARFCAEPFLLRETGSGTRDVMERALAARGLRITNPVMSLGSTEAIKRAVAAGIGVAFVSRLTLRLELLTAVVAVLPLSDLSLRRPLFIIRQAGKQQTHATAAFLRELKSSLSERPEGRG